MRCVRIVGQGVPTRLTDAEAAKVVRQGDGEYCTKEFWKKWWDRAGMPRAFGVRS